MDDSFYDWVNGEGSKIIDDLDEIPKSLNGIYELISSITNYVLDDSNIPEALRKACLEEELVQDTVDTLESVLDLDERMYQLMGLSPFNESERVSLIRLKRALGVFTYDQLVHTLELKEAVGVEDSKIVDNFILELVSQRNGVRKADLVALNERIWEEMKKRLSTDLQDTSMDDSY